MIFIMTEIYYHFKNSYVIIVVLAGITIFMSSASLIALSSAINFYDLENYFNHNSYLELFFSSKIDLLELKSIQEQISSDSLVARVDYISEEIALEVFKDEFKDDPQKTLGYNPFSSSLRVYIKSQHFNYYVFSKLKEEYTKLNHLEYISEIDFIRYISFWKKYIIKFIGMAILGIVIIGVILIYYLLDIFLRQNLEQFKNAVMLGGSIRYVTIPAIILCLLSGLVCMCVGTTLGYILNYFFIGITKYSLHIRNFPVLIESKYVFILGLSNYFIFFIVIMLKFKNYFKKRF